MTEARTTIEAGLVRSDHTALVPRGRKAVRYGDRIIEAPYIFNCITCNSPHRGDIETLRAFGHNARQIMNCIPEDAAIRREKDGSLCTTARFSRRIRDHHKGGPEGPHSPIDKAVAIGVLEQYAVDLEASDVSETVGTLVSAKGYLTNLLHQANTGVVKGGYVSPGDGIRAATALIKIEQSEQSEDLGVQYWIGVFDRHHYLATDMMGPADRRIFEQLCANDAVIAGAIKILDAKRLELASGGVGSEFTAASNPGEYE